MRRLALALILVLGLASGTAAANRRFLTYQVHSGDSLESIAAEFYGNRARANLIQEFNNLQKGQKLKEGQDLRVPIAYRYRLNPGDDLRSVSQRLVGDPRRGPLLVQLSGLRPGERVGPGTELVIPFHFLYTVKKGDTLSGIAKTYYGDAAQARILVSYNFLPRPQPPLPGEKLIIPIASLRVRAVRLAAQARRPTPAPAPPPPRQQAPKPPVPAPVPAPVATPLPVATPDSAAAEERQIAAQVGERMRRAEGSYHDGNYTEVPALLVKLLTEVDPTEAQLVDIYRLLACAYVALGETELAVNAFREVLDRKPEFRLDPVQTSPKIRAALNAARGTSPQR